VVVLIVEVTVREGLEPCFLAAIDEDLRHSVAREPYCLRFDVLQDAETPRKYYFYEAYRDEAALEADRQTPHLKRTETQMGDLFEGRQRPYRSARYVAFL
jgi:autoinducer 2-degrading protein